MNFHLKLRLRPRFSSSSKSPYVLILDPFAAKSDRLVALLRRLLKLLGRTDTSDPVSTRKLAPVFLSVSRRRRCFAGPLAVASSCLGLSSFPKLWFLYGARMVFGNVVLCRRIVSGSSKVHCYYWNH